MNCRFPNRKIVRFAAIFFIFLLISLALLYGFRRPLLSAIGRSVIETSDPKDIDYIVLLAGSYPRGVLEAADLYREHPGSMIIVTNERNPDGFGELKKRIPTVMSASEFHISLLQQMGIPRTTIEFLTPVIESTRDEANVVSDYLRKKPHGTVALIPRTPQSKRAGHLFRNSLGPEFSVHVVTSRYDEINAANWWKDTWYLNEVAIELLKHIYSGLTRILPLENR